MRGLIFDIDDTLYSRQILFVKAAEEVLGKSIGSITDFVRIFYDVSDLNTRDLEQGKITTRECNGWRFEQTFKRMDIPFKAGDGVKAADHYLRLQSRMCLSDRMRSVLDRLKDDPGIRLGVITAGASDHQWNKIRMLGLEKWIDHENIIVAGDVGVSKPDVRIFRMMEDRLGLDPSDMWMAGDSYKHDIKGALDAGWHAIWLNRRGIRVSGTEPDVEVTDDASFEDILSLFKDQD